MGSAWFPKCKLNAEKSPSNPALDDDITSNKLLGLNHRDSGVCLLQQVANPD